jgi:ribosome-associated toxin RatA of RatAB toxin-antitoxin module
MNYRVAGVLRKLSRSVPPAAWLVVLLAFMLAFSPPCLSADWALSESQLQQLKSGAVISEGEVAPDRPAADIRAAVQVSASPETVFRTLTDCKLALRFVPHLKRCNVLDTAADGSWQDVEQLVDYGWLAPRANYVFHADYDRFKRIRFTNLRGDFRENHGVWEFQSLNGGQATLVTYQARVAPAFYVPRWMMRSMLKRDLPDLMRGLRSYAESTRLPAATKSSTPTGP